MSVDATASNPAGRVMRYSAAGSSRRAYAGSTPATAPDRTAAATCGNVSHAIAGAPSGASAGHSARSVVGTASGASSG